MEKQPMPFPFAEESEAFWNSHNEAVASETNKLRDRWIPKENVQHYKHGVHFQSHNTTDPDQTSTMKEHAHEIRIRHADIIECKHALLLRQVLEIAHAMDAHFQNSLFATISESTEKHNQVIDAKGLRPGQAYLSMLKKIEFGVDRNGKVTHPEIHPANNIEAIQKDMAQQSEDFRKEVEDVIKEKTQAAEARERERLEKFMRC